MSPYFHIFIDRIDAGRNQASGALDFYHAHPASGDLVDLLQVAESRDLDMGQPGCFQYGGAFGSTYFYAVNFNRNILHIHSPSVTVCR